MGPISREEAMEVLATAMVAHIGVIADDEPYVTPMSYAVDGDRILFRTMPGRKLEAIKSAPTVSIEVSHLDEATGDWVSVIVRGTAVESEDEADRARVIELLMDKYRDVIGSPLSTGGMHLLGGAPNVVVVSIDEVTGMSSGRGWEHRTRPGRL
jgi:nitroimidazol reductase NimA-like FMN-containing flavoprotein (pyridoxamine 5'-phosphate oxidase superfamily)